MTESLTGVWDGTYVQSRIGMVTFLATLIETGGALGGNVTEPCIRPDCLVGGHPQRFDCRSSIWQRRLIRQTLRAIRLRL
jgi:hypothetical protein